MLPEDEPKLRYSMLIATIVVIMIGIGGMAQAGATHVP